MFIKGMVLLPMLLAVITCASLTKSHWEWFFGFYYGYQVLSLAVHVLWSQMQPITPPPLPPPPPSPAWDADDLEKTARMPVLAP